MSTDAPTIEIPERQGTLPKATRPAARDPERPLTPGEKKKLWNLGYLKTHLADLTPSNARRAIKLKIYRPGSKAYNDHQPAGLRVPANQTDEAIVKANRSRPAPSGISIVVDEYTNLSIRGENPLDVVLNQASAAHPTLHFRLINPDLPATAGPQFQMAYDADGKQIEVGGLKLGYMPKSVYDEHYRKPNLERSQQMMGAISKKNLEDQELALGPADAEIAPIKQERFQAVGNMNQM